MKTSSITILSVIGVLGTAAVTMAINADALSSASQRPIDGASEILVPGQSSTSTPFPTPSPSSTDDPATHDLNDDHGVDDPATHDVNDDHGSDDPATHDINDDHGGGDNSGSGSDNSGSGSDDSGSGHGEDD